MTVLDSKISARHLVVTVVLERLYLFPRTELQKVLTQLIHRNSKLHGNQQEVLSYRGEFYAVGGIHRGQRPNLLHPTLREELKEYLARKKALDVEYNKVRGFLQKLVATFASLDDYCAVMPDTLTPVLLKLEVYFDLSVPEAPAHEQQQFITAHDEYLELLRARMTYNLLGAPNV